MSNRQVGDEIAKRALVTLELLLWGVAIGALVGIPLGARAAARRGSLFDQVVNRLSTKGVSDPEEVRRGLSLAARAWNDPMLADIDPELVYSNEFLSPDL